MSKAYDRVEYSFLFQPLQLIGLRQHFRDLIRVCVYTTSSGVSKNVDVDGYFCLEKGLRHGCLLSPYLFIILIEVLSSLLCYRESKRVFRGMKANNSTPITSSLMFVDDLMIFGGAFATNLETTKHILDLYSSWSGQVINYSKSSIYFTNNISNSVKLNFPTFSDSIL